MLKASRIFSLVTILTVSVLLGSSRYFGTFDSLAFWGGVQVFLQGGDPYNFDLVKQALSSHFAGIPETQHFVSPPWTLALLTPIFAWDFQIAKMLLAIFSLTTYLFCVSRLNHLWGRLPFLGMVAVWMYVPLWTCLFYGQISVALLLGSVLALEWSEDTRRPWWKWALALTLLAIKPQGSFLVFPFLVAEGIRGLSRRDAIALVTVGGVVITLLFPFLLYLPSWLGSAGFSISQRTATLSAYVQDVGKAMGSDSALWLWALPSVLFIVLIAFRARITNGASFLLILTLSQLTAPYIWVYDSCALMPLFYALIGAAVAMKTHRWRWYLGIVFTSISIFPIYLAIDPDFSFMRMHNVCLAIAAVLLLPGMRGYFKQ